MAQDTIKRLKERANKAKNEMDLNRGMFEDAYDYIIPYRNTFNMSSGGQSHEKPTKQYDSTAMIAGVNFVNKLQSDFTPQFSRWAELKAGPAVQDEIARSEQNEVYEAINMLLTTYRNASNFTLASAEMYFDLGIGTGVMFILEGDEERPINYVAVPLSKVGIEDGRYGEVSGLYRFHSVKANLIKAQWPKAKLTDEIMAQMKQKPDAKIALIEAFYFDYDDLVWYQDLITEKDENRLFSDKFSEAPFVAPRWMKIPGFATGIGPFVMAMADYKTLNKMVEFSLQMAALNIFGAYTVADNSAFNPNTATVTPSSFIPVERNDTRNPSIAALPRSGDFQAQEFMISNLKDQIRQTMLDNRLPPETQPIRTAFEISERIKALQSDIGVAFGRLYFEFVLPLHKREIAILERRGLIGLPKGFKIDNFAVQVDVVSPVAFQQSVEDVNRFMQAYQMSSSINPQAALLSYDIENIPRWINEKLGAPSKLLRDDVQKAQLQQAVAQLIAQSQQAPVE